MLSRICIGVVVLLIAGALAATPPAPVGSSYESGAMALPVGDPDAGRLGRVGPPEHAEGQILDREIRRRVVGRLDPAPQRRVVRGIEALGSSRAAHNSFIDRRSSRGSANEQLPKEIANLSRASAMSSVASAWSRYRSWSSWNANESATSSVSTAARSCSRMVAPLASTPATRTLRKPNSVAPEAADERRSDKGAGSRSNIVETQRLRDTVYIDVDIVGVAVDHHSEMSPRIKGYQRRGDRCRLCIEELSPVRGYCGCAAWRP